MFRNDAINTVAMGITFSKVALCIFKFFFFNWMLMYSAMTILEVYTNKKKNSTKLVFEDLQRTCRTLFKTMDCG